MNEPHFYEGIQITVQLPAAAALETDMQQLADDTAEERAAFSRACYRAYHKQHPGCPLPGFSLEEHNDL